MRAALRCLPGLVSCPARHAEVRPHAHTHPLYTLYRTTPDQVVPTAAPPLDDPRHLDDSPMPWLRYFFPKDFDVREGVPLTSEPYFQYFDVRPQPLQVQRTGSAVLTEPGRTCL